MSRNQQGVIEDRQARLRLRGIVQAQRPLADLRHRLACERQRRSPAQRPGLRQEIFRTRFPGQGHHGTSSEHLAHRRRSQPAEHDRSMSFTGSRRGSPFTCALSIQRQPGILAP